MPGGSGLASPSEPFADSSVVEHLPRVNPKAKDVAKVLALFCRHFQTMNAMSSLAKETATTEVVATKAKVAARASARLARASVGSATRSVLMARP